MILDEHLRSAVIGLWRQGNSIFAIAYLLELTPGYVRDAIDDYQEYLKSQD